MKTNDELRKDVMEEFKWDPELRNVATEVGVAVKDGVVTLSGTVDTYKKKIAAEKAAQRVGGVKVIASDVTVKLPASGKKNDTDIAVAIKNALRWNSSVNDDKIEVKVDNGWVYLEGNAEWDYERLSAERSVEDLIGVRGVTNNILIKSQAIDTHEMQKKIAAAFVRNANIDASSIHANANGSKITLTGKVRSWSEKKEAENIAWSTPGVLSVDNQVEIDVGIYA